MNMEQMMKTIYESPNVEVVELKVEQGFASSGNFTVDGGWMNEDGEEW